MKKRRKIKPQQVEPPVIQNFVAKYARQFNKSAVFKDKTKYQRKAKHKAKEPFIVSLKKGITKGFLLKNELRLLVESKFSLNPSSIKYTELTKFHIQYHLRVL